jgi:hypothetical protein
VRAATAAGAPREPSYVVSRPSGCDLIVMASHGRRRKRGGVGVHLRTYDSAGLGAEHPPSMALAKASPKIMARSRAQGRPAQLFDGTPDGGEYVGFQQQPLKRPFPMA